MSNLSSNSESLQRSAPLAGTLTAAASQFILRCIDCDRAAMRFDEALADVAAALCGALGAPGISVWCPRELPVEEGGGDAGAGRSSTSEFQLVYATGASGAASGAPLETLLRVGRLGTSEPGATSAGVPELHFRAPLASNAGRRIEHAAVLERLARDRLERALAYDLEFVLARVYEALDRLDRDPFGAMGAVAHAVRDRMHFEACTILEADDARRALHVAGTTGIDSAVPPRKMQYAYGYSCSGWVAEQRRPLMLEDWRAFPRHTGPKFPDRVESAERYQYLGAPLLSHSGDLLGVVRLRNRRVAAGAAAPLELTAVDRARLERLSYALVPLLHVAIQARRVYATMARVRHDLDMPATAIRDGAGVLLREPDDYFTTQLASVRQKLEDIESFAEILLLNSELMGLAEEGDVPLRPESVLLLGGFVAKLCKMLTPAGRRRGLNGILYNQGSFFSIPALYLDPRLFQIAMYNILQNALKYSDPGTWISVEGEAARLDGQTWYLIHVKNTGFGVTDEERGRIFERHFRSPRARRRSDSGLGIGLPTARAFIERHGGRLVLTRAHQPTVFTIQLPGYLATRRPD